MKGLEVVVGVSGASGAQLARRFVDLAVTAPELSRLHLIFSDPALRVARNEIDPSIEKPSDWLASLSATRRAKGTLGSIANGISRDLVGRAAEVMLKERRPLLLAFRESPYSLVAIENMRRATSAGAVLIPPTPAFYIGAASMERFLDAYCIRAGRWLGLTI